MKFNYAKLRGKVREVFSTQDEFAKAIGMSKTSLSMKFNNRLEFTQQEIGKAAELLKIDSSEIPVYFFTQEVQEIEQ